MKPKSILSLILLALFFIMPTEIFAAAAEGAEEVHHAMPAFWSVIPFVALLLMIATGPLFYAKFWHHYYPHVSVALGVVVVGYYLIGLHEFGHPVHSFFEYFSFISLLTALFVASGGILIKVDKKGTPLTNVALLIFGAFIANIIGTTGASMLLIRPFIRLNNGRIKPYHIVFFIFMVSNVGGCLTPIGDPPLFLGFLKGIDFFWTTTNIWQYWILGIGLLAVIFYFIDKRNTETSSETEYSGKIELIGAKNIIFLAITIGAVFIDPNVIDMPSWAYISYHGDKFSYVREIIMLATAVAAFKMSDKTALKGNDFNFEPIREVAFLFIGIFATMMPALQLIGDFAANEGQALITSDSLYWLTGMLSGVLDNAPTYMNFLSAGMGKVGLNVSSISDVKAFQAMSTEPGAVAEGFLLAISVSAVFFGAFTYIGNAPNFMVKAIAEQNGIEMPSFIAYIIKYSATILVPVLIVVWLFKKFVFVLF
jgi:Na+/H+ antiporter NhaD/arsenite permease-like protein